MTLLFVILAAICFCYVLKLLPVVAGDHAFLGIGAIFIVFVLFFFGMVFLYGSGDPRAKGVADGIFALLGRLSMSECAIGGLVIGIILAAFGAKGQ